MKNSAGRMPGLRRMAASAAAAPNGEVPWLEAGLTAVRDAVREQLVGVLRLITGAVEDQSKAVEEQAEMSLADASANVWAAVRVADMASLERLLEADPASIFSRGAVGETLLHMCYLFNSPHHIAIAHILLRKAPSLVDSVYEVRGAPPARLRAPVSLPALPLTYPSSPGRSLAGPRVPRRECAAHVRCESGYDRGATPGLSQPVAHPRPGGWPLLCTRRICVLR